MTDAMYFSSTKKGEMRELRDDLNSQSRDKNREAVKRVIAAMTVGKDVSSLFTEVIKSMGTSDLELKKLVYLYIINYARAQPEKAVLVVSMFCKDATEHPNPLVRALALRTMGCIRVDRIAEYLCDPLNLGLRDKDPYVRKTAAICVAKFYDLNRELVEERGFIDNLRELLSDANPMVVANAVAALTEICEASGEDHFRIVGATLSKLLTALGECSEWGRVFILDALSRFETTSAAEALDIADRVAPQLNHSNSAVVMAATKVMLKNAQRLADRDADRISRKLAAPLISLLSSAPETQFVALRNIELIAQRFPSLFAKDARVFFVRFNDEPYVKTQKLSILQRLATKGNASLILAELEQYASDVDLELVRRSVRAIGRIAVRLPSAADRCVAALSRLTQSRGDLVGGEAVVALQLIVRRYPRRFEAALVALCESLCDLSEARAKAAFVWLLGEYAQHIGDAEARLEAMIDSFTSEEHSVQLQMLTATVKLFLKRPQQSRGLVERVLRLATEASADPDLRDRGFVYWRLLSTDPSAARKVVLAERPELCADADALSGDYLSALLLNLSSLSAVYHKTPDEFVVDAKDVRFHKVGEYDSDSSSYSTCDCSDGDCGRYRARGRARDTEPESDSDSEAEPETVESAPPKATKESPLPDLMSQLFPAAPPKEEFALAFASTKSDGLTMRVAFARRGGAAVMTAQCVNNGKEAIGRIDVKFNKNYLGCAPRQTLPLSGDLLAGTSQTVDVALTLSMDPKRSQPNQPIDTSVQMAARSMLKVSDGRSTANVHLFTQCVPAEIFFDADGHYGAECVSLRQPKKFLAGWKSIGATTETKQIFDSERSVEEVQSVLEKKRFAFVAKREVIGRGHSLYFVTQLGSASVLFELSVANHGKCRAVVRSRDAWFARIVCDAAVSLLGSTDQKQQ